jgi:hypothetical protein
MKVRGARLSAAEAQTANLPRILYVNSRDKPRVHQVLLQLVFFFQTEVAVVATSQGQEMPYFLSGWLLN